MVIYKNYVIKTLCLETFDLSKLDFVILGEFAKKGDTLRCRILLGELSDRQTSRRIDLLYESGFLYLKKSIPYRTDSKMHNRVIKVFSLSLKGLIASLGQISLEDTFLFNDFLNVIRQEVSSSITKLYTDYIKTELIYFLEINKIRGIKLDSISDILSWIMSCNHKYGFSVSQKKAFDERIKERSYIGDEIELNIPDDLYGQEQMENWYYLRNYWFYVINEISKGNTITKIISRMKKVFLSRHESYVQTELAKRRTKEMSESIKTDLKIDKIQAKQKKEYLKKMKYSVPKPIIKRTGPKRKKRVNIR